MFDVEFNEETGTITIDNGSQYIVLESSQAREVAKVITEKITEHSLKENRKIAGFEGKL